MNCQGNFRGGGGGRVQSLGGVTCSWTYLRCPCSKPWRGSFLRVSVCMDQDLCNSLPSSAFESYSQHYCLYPAPICNLYGFCPSHPALHHPYHPALHCQKQISVSEHWEIEEQYIAYSNMKMHFIIGNCITFSSFISLYSINPFQRSTVNYFSLVGQHPVFPHNSFPNLALQLLVTSGQYEEREEIFSTKNYETYS